MAWSSRSGGSAADPAEALPSGRSTCWAPPASDGAIGGRPGSGRSGGRRARRARVARSRSGRPGSPPRRSPCRQRRVTEPAPREARRSRTGRARPISPDGRAAVGRRAGSRRPASGGDPGPRSASCPGRPHRTGRDPLPAANASGRELGRCRQKLRGRCARPEREPGPAAAARPRARTQDGPTPLSPADDRHDRVRPLGSGRSWSASGASPTAVGGAPPRSAWPDPGPRSAAVKPPRPVRALAAVRGPSRPASGRAPTLSAAACRRRQPRLGAVGGVVDARGVGDPGAGPWPVAGPPSRTRARPLSAAEPRAALRVGTHPGALSVRACDPASSRRPSALTSPRQRGRRCAERLRQPGALRTRAPSKARRGGRTCSSRGPRIAGLIRLPDVDGLRRRCAPALRPRPAPPTAAAPPTRRTCHRGADPPGFEPLSSSGPPHRLAHRRPPRIRRYLPCGCRPPPSPRRRSGRRSGGAAPAHPPEIRLLHPGPLPSLWVTKSARWSGSALSAGWSLARAGRLYRGHDDGLLPSACAVEPLLRRPCRPVAIAACRPGGPR